MRTKPSATSEYMTPFSNPLMVSSMAKRRSGMRHVLEADDTRHVGRAPVLVGDRGAHGHRVGAPVVERVDDVVVALVDEATPQLARARDLPIVGVELLVEEREAAYALRGRQRLVGAPYLVEDQGVDLGVLGQIRVPRVGN